MADTAVSILKGVRRARGLSYRKLAVLAGVSHEAIRQIELGLHEPRPETVAAVAEALGIPPDMLDIEVPAADDRQPVAT